MQSDDKRPRDELNALILAHSLGELSETERDRLETLVREDAEARQRYLAYIQVEAQLHWRFSQATKPDPLELATPAKRLPGHYRRRRILWWASVGVCAAAILFLALWISWPRGIVEAPDGRGVDHPGRSLAENKVESDLSGTKVVPVKVASRYAAPIELAGWLILPAEGSDYEIDGKRFLLRDGEVYVASTNAGPVDRRFQIETPVGHIQARGTRYFVSTEPINNPTTLHAKSEKTDMNTVSTIGHRTRVLVLAGVVMLTNSLGEAEAKAGEQIVATDRTVPAKLQAEGNFKEALTIYRKLVVDPAHGGFDAATDILATIECLKRLKMQQEWDQLAEAIVAAHPSDWRVLYAVARGYGQVDKWGSVVKDKFIRCDERGGQIGTNYRDCIRTMQLMQQALPYVAQEKDGKATFDFYKYFVELFPIQNDAWRLQSLTDLETLPDYGVQTSSTSPDGVAVDKDGQPIFHHLPQSWKEAKSDGQRWRWLLEQMAKADSDRADESRMIFADFLQSKLGVQYRDNRLEFTPDGKVKEGPNSVHTLKENETLAQLASGVRRLTLPDEFNFIRIYKVIAQNAPKGPISPLKDLSYQIYRGTWDRLPDFDKLKPVDQKKLPSGLINVGIVEPADRFGMVFTATLNVPADGEYTVSLDSDDGSRIRIGDDFVLDLDGLHGHGIPKTATVKLSRGEHPVRVEFFENGGEENIIIFWRGPGIQGRQYWTASRETTPPETAMERLTQIYTNRMQLDKAAAEWRQLIEKFGPYKNFPRRRKLEQLEQNWGRFARSKAFTPGQPIKLAYDFRNGKHVDLTATRVDIESLLRDIKAYLKSNPKKVKDSLGSIDGIGSRLVSKNKDKYLDGKPVASWSVDLEPLPKHWDRRIDIEVPVKQTGAYLVEAKMADGNTNRIIALLTDTMIVSQLIDQGTLYLVLDAKTGKPVPNANVEVFSYWNQEIPKKLRVEGGRTHNLRTKNFAEKSNVDGMVVTKFNQDERKDTGAEKLNSMVIARGEKGDRLGLYGIDYRIYYMDYKAEDYQDPQAYVVTDRPIYRPGQTVHFKAWIRATRHDMAYVSHFAGQEFLVEIHDSQGDYFIKKRLKANEYGAIEDSFTLEEDAPLGDDYDIHIYAEPYVNPFTKEKRDRRGLGDAEFRVEEYKKPEFEVTVEAPSEPIALGESFEATLRAKYYFGQPVTNAKVHYKVERKTRYERWLPGGPWDWLYGPGYWWRECKYDCFPDWDEWGWSRCIDFPGKTSEIVAEDTVTLGPDGTAKIKIDTALAKENCPQADHTYTITAEVTDESRRTITGEGSVIAARNPFDVCAWTSGGHYRVGDTIEAHFQSQRADGKSVVAKGTVTLYGVTYDDNDKPTEKVLETWPIETKADGRATLKIKTPRSGQFRIAGELTNAKGQTQIGATIVTVTGNDQDESNFRFNDLELLLDRDEYAPGDQVRLLINTKRPDSTVFLFVRPINSVYRAPEVIQLDGRSAVRTIDVNRSDMPNFFVEAMTVIDGRLHHEVRRIIVPPVKRIINVAIEPSEDRYQPGKKVKVKVRLTDSNGKPIVGETVLSVYDKSIEYIGGTHPSSDIRRFFWSWQRHHSPRHHHNLDRSFSQLIAKGEIRMQDISHFQRVTPWNQSLWWQDGLRGYYWGYMPCCSCEAPLLKKRKRTLDASLKYQVFGRRVDELEENLTVRKNFADLAYWAGSIITDETGTAEIEIPMPDNLTTWKIIAVSVAHGTVVGQGSTEVITTKDLLLRLQAPRFFVERDEVILSANVHNYIEGERDIQVGLDLAGGVLALDKGQQAKQSVRIAAGADRRIDWRVRVIQPGKAVVRMSATTQQDALKASDAVEMTFPAYVHGMLKTESYSAAITPDGKSVKLTVNVPEKRRAEQTHLEIRYSPSIALAMVNALPYLVGYEYKQTEATLSRFVPLARTQRILVDMGIDLKAVSDKTTNLNPQEIDDAKKRAARWKVGEANPVFDQAKVDRLVQRGLRELARRQKENGGWSWNPEDEADAHTTAYVVHGLQTTQAAGMAIVPDMLKQGVAWLEKYQKAEAQKIANEQANPKKKPRKPYAEDLDAFVAMVLAEAGKPNAKMLDYLYRDRTKLSVYSLAMLGLTFDTLEQNDRRDMCLRNVKQYLVTDEENQSAYLRLPKDRCWWRWYESDIETHAYFLKLLARVEPKDQTASGVAKYLLNNRNHGTWWNSTRDTALALEALADFVTTSGEAKPDMTVELLVDGKRHKEIRITPENLFTFDNVLHLRADQLDTGKHTIELQRKGAGPVYLNAYMTNFTTEDFITKAGLEIKVERRYYKLVRNDQKIKAVNSQSKPIDYSVEHYRRIPLKTGDQLQSGDLVEVELILDSKNDYEHLLFEDFKPAGFEPVEVRSGRVRGAQMELRDEKVAFLVRWLPRGGRTIKYRLRAEIPGTFSAMPTKGTGVYAPELRANSDEMKLRITE